MPENDLDLLMRAAEDAGKIALGFFNDDPEVWEKDDNAGPVTEADLAVNTHLESVLKEARPDYGWLSEETEDDLERQDTRYQFIIDPIDGTRAFIDGTKDWAHSIAVVEDGSPIAAVVAMPARDLVYAAALGTGATLNGAPIRCSAPQPLHTATILTARPNLRPEFWIDGKRPAFETAFRSSLAYRMCLAAEGRFNGMMTFRPTWEWDIAAGALIVSEAGGKVVDQSGAPLRFNNEHPQVSGVLAGAPDTINALLSAMV